MHRFFLLVFCLICTTAGHAQGTRTATAIPGTGIKMVAPPGLAIARAGATLIDSSGETIINFMMSDSRFRLDQDPTWLAIFKRPPEVTTGSLEGKLYRRTRAEDGGGWDGWMLSVPRRDKVLTVMAMYTGSSPAFFQGLRNHLLTIVWDERVSDPEFATGASLAPPGLKLVRGTYGGLAYTSSGIAGAAGPSLLVQALPVAASKMDLLFPAACQSALADGFRGRPFVGPNLVERHAFAYCEAWSKEDAPEMNYVAMVRVKDGGVLSVIGSGPASTFASDLTTFRQAVAGLKPTAQRLLPPSR